MGPDGYPLIGYRDHASLDLEYRDCSNLACTTSAMVTLDPDGSSPAMAFGMSGAVLIAYYDAASGDLEYVRCPTTTCSGAVPVKLDQAGDVGQHPSIAVSPDDRPHIVYVDRTNKELKWFRCDDETCSGGTAASKQNLQSNAAAGRSSIAFTSRGDAVLVWQDYVGGGTTPILNGGVCSDFACAKMQTIAGENGGFSPSVAIRPGDLPIATFWRTGTRLQAYDIPASQTGERYARSG
jgi:hypothetical protein